MKIQLFVTCSATFLAVWLGVTFFREVPHEAYPQLGKGSRPFSAKHEKLEKKEPMVALEQEELEAVEAAETVAVAE